MSFDALFITDDRITDLHEARMVNGLASLSLAPIAVTDQTKLLNRFAAYVENLAANGLNHDIRRLVRLPT